MYCTEQSRNICPRDYFPGNVCVPFEREPAAKSAHGKWQLEWRASELNLLPLSIKFKGPKPQKKIHKTTFDRGCSLLGEHKKRSAVTVCLAVCTSASQFLGSLFLFCHEPCDQSNWPAQNISLFTFNDQHCYLLRGRIRKQKKEFDTRRSQSHKVVSFVTYERGLYCPRQQRKDREMWQCVCDTFTQIKIWTFFC